MNCPKCKSTNYCKDGKALGRQRYLCRKCRYRYTVKRAKGRADEATKRQALQLYLEGLGFRSIGRILNFSNVTILNWIRSFGKKITQIQNPHAAKVIEIDEMHTYIGSKKQLLDMDCC